MNTSEQYLFTSERLGFRTWRLEDISPLSRINSDQDVMEHFPSILSEPQTAAFIERMQDQQRINGHSYFATELLYTGEFIGFIGLGLKDFEADFTPCVDIGWRIAKAHWNKGYATEGALRNVQYAFEVLELDTVYSLAPELNLPSIQVMKKIGMNYRNPFKHPQLLDFPLLEDCVSYQLSR